MSNRVNMDSKNIMGTSEEADLLRRVDEAMQNPGVAEAMELYRRYAAVERIYQAGQASAVVVTARASSSTSIEGQD